MTQVLLSVDDEEAAERDPRLLLQNAVGARNCHRLISQQRILDVSETAFLARRVDPGQVSEVRVGGDADHFATDCAEFRHPLGESDDFRWADEGATEEKERVLKVGLDSELQLSSRELLSFQEVTL